MRRRSQLDVYDLGAEDATEDDPTATPLTIEDDEEIDSDEAWDEEDEDRFSHYTFASDKTRKSAKQSVDLNEEEEEEDEMDEDDEGDLMDLSEMFGKQAASDEDDSESIPGSDAEDDEDEDEANYLAADRLRSFVGGLDRSARQSAKSTATGAARKLQQTEERTEAYAESEYNLTLQATDTSGGSGGKLSFSDLYGAVADQTGLRSLKQSIKALDKQASSAKQPSAAVQAESGEFSVGAPLAAPLAKRIQARFDRQVAYEETSQQLGERWDQTVQRNREADHVSFVDRTLTRQKATSESLAAHMKPANDLERLVQQALTDSGMREKDVKEQETLALNKLSIEEVQARQNELRLLRELMFREERKAKRVKKIKSKAYRRLHKKERERQQQLVDEQNAEDDPEEARQQVELARARERMTLRHKNTGKWAKEALRHGGTEQNLETREAIQEQLARHEALKRKIAGDTRDPDASDASSSDSDRDSDVEAASDGDAADRAKRKALAKLAQLTESTTATEDRPRDKGVFAMKFMQDAFKRQAEETRRLAEDARRDLEEMDHPAQYDDSDHEMQRKDDPQQAGRMIGNNPGRRVFESDERQLDQSAQQATEELLESLPVSKKSAAVRLSAAVEVDDTRRQRPTAKQSRTSELTATSSDANPWLSTEVDGKRASKKRAVISQADKATEKLKRAKTRADFREDVSGVKATIAGTSINVDMTLVAPSPSTTKGPKQPSSKTAAHSMDSDADSDVDSMLVDADSVMNSAKNPNAFTQRELVERAFANDDVVTELFEEEKEAAMQNEAPQEQQSLDPELPGWGSWGGAGCKQRKAARNKPSAKKTLAGSGVERNKRRDVQLKHVMISEKKVKKVEKYAVAAVPFPYKSREQYERSLQQPLGREWNTADTYRRANRPRVEKRDGVTIEAIE